MPKRIFPDITLYQLLFEQNKKFIPSNACYIDAEDHTQQLTFAEVQDIILKFGAGIKLQFEDFKQGDVVAFYAGNCLTYAAAIHGPVVIGGVSTTIDASSDAVSASIALKTVNAKILITDSSHLNKARKAAKLANLSEQNIFLFDEGNEIHQLKDDLSEYQTFTNAFLKHNDFATPVTYSSNKLATVPCFYCFTSGTTGKKKAVTITHKSLTSALQLKDDWLPPTLSMLLHTDFHHVSSLLITFHMNVYHGCTSYILKEYTFEKLLRGIQTCKANVISTQPWIVAAMVKEFENIVEKKGYDLSSLMLVVCGGAFIDKTACMSFYQKYKAPLVNAYGMTEILNFLESSFPGTLKGEMGCLSTGFSCKLLDQNGKEVGYNTAGELCVKGPTLTPGYYDNDELNAASFDKDGFFHTGDLFKVNEDGVLFFIDRLKDIIKHKVHHIAPQDIESVLMQYPLVTDCAAVGVYSDEETCWLPRAFVLLSSATEKKDLDTIKQELLNLVKEKLPPQSQLYGGLYLCRDLPRTSTGKIERRTLRLSDRMDQWLF
ncbi:hypothetical protein BDF20DRAFT_918040 [Mycotypha africana]|uniref:uncharacterized protein n=1 Tax=Mycotypha africana TaxID=64632 RepID=UPI0023015588|nr:uncharacterized protein BDF20DRAFT_918040 [Mycotypha africana]KAI8966957.1 hypothetical protein BDF20DRAFT_918040 [Mycotypha africana]